jgi:hypothetical protein
VSPARSIALGEAWGRLAAVPTRLPSAGEASAFAGAAAAAAALGWSSGGYYATAWNTGTVVALGVACTALLRSRGFRLSRAGASMPILLAAFVAWLGLQALRRGAATFAVPEVERGALYLAVLSAAVLTIRASNARAAAAGLLAGIVALSCAGLVALLLPQRVEASAYEGRLLFEPLGYANGAGILAGIGLLLAFGTASHAHSRRARTLAAAALVPLFTALALTQSRGAIVATAIGMAAGLVLNRERRRLALGSLLLVPLPLLSVGLAARSHVTDVATSTEVIARDGRIVAATLVLLTAAQAAFARRCLRELPSSLPAARVWALVAGSLVVAGAVHVGLGALGDRPEYWRVALTDYRAQPLLGSGPATFGRAWLQHRHAPVNALNAHNLYLETIAEVGPIGLALLLAALAVPLGVAWKRRGTVTASACSAYVAFLAHAALDWDWQLPAVTVAALLCAAVALSAASPGKERRRWATRVPALAAALLALAAAGAGIGNRALADATRAAQRGDWAAAARSAHTAARWQPWSAEPRRILGESYLAAGETVRARQALEGAVRLDSGDWRTWYELGSVGDRATRRIALARIVELNPLSLTRARPHRGPR